MLAETEDPLSTLREDDSAGLLVGAPKTMQNPLPGDRFQRIELGHSKQRNEAKRDQEIIKELHSLEMLEEEEV